MVRAEHSADTEQIRCVLYLKCYLFGDIFFLFFFYPRDIEAEAIYNKCVLMNEIAGARVLWIVFGFGYFYSSVCAMIRLIIIDIIGEQVHETMRCNDY